MAISVGGDLIRTIAHQDAGEQRAIAVAEIATAPAPADFIYQMLDTSGAGTATYEQAAGTAIYKIVPPAGQVYQLRRMNIYIEDDGAWRGDRYGAGAALTNGIVISVENAGGTLYNMTPEPIHKLGEWGLLAGVDMSWSSFAGGNDIALIRWTFTNGAGHVMLDGDNGEWLQMNIRDNLTTGGAALVSHMTQVQGRRYVK